MFDAADALVDSFGFNSIVNMTETANGLAVAFLGDDIGATFDGNFTVDIPVSFQTVSVGLVSAGGFVEISYDLRIASVMALFSEIVRWRFSDPLSVDQGVNAPVLAFLAPAPIPQPASLPLMAAALGLSFCVGRRRRARIRRAGRSPNA